MDYVKCMLCGEEFSAITGLHLKSAHSITFNEYHEMFPSAETCIDRTVNTETRQLISQSLKDYYTTNSVSSNTRQLISKANKGREFSDEHKRNISKAKLGHEVDVATRQAIADTLRGHEASEETRQRMSESRTKEVRRQIAQSLEDYYANNPISEETSQKRSRSLTDYYINNPETRQQISDKMKEHFKDPEFVRKMVEAWQRAPNEPELRLQLVLE